AFGGVWAYRHAQDVSKRRKLERARRSSHRPKRSLGELAEFDAGQRSSARVLSSPRLVPSIGTSLVHLTLPRGTRTHGDLCFLGVGADGGAGAGCNTFYVLSGSGMALANGSEVPVDPGDVLIFRPGSAFYVANTGWRGQPMALLWLAEPAAPQALLARGRLVESYDDGRGYAFRAARAVASGLSSVAVTGTAAASSIMSAPRSRSAVPDEGGGRGGGDGGGGDGGNGLSGDNGGSGNGGGGGGGSAKAHEAAAAGTWRGV
ncbi:unnamed protein product, partial [Phaeothamnion confervicola]